MKDIKILISSILILISFFLGYYFAENKNTYKIVKKEEKKNYVNLDILKTKVKITKNENTIITINWEIIEDSIIELK